MQTYPFTGPFGTAAIDLAVWTNGLNVTNIYIGANNQVSQIEFYPSLNDGNYYFNVLANPFALDYSSLEGLITSPEIKIAAYGPYVTFKLSWEDALYVMAICD